MTNHLELAREDLVIAESGDSKREAYRRAAEHIAAHIEETGETKRNVATLLERQPDYVSKLLRWRNAGYPEGTTPFTMADPNGSRPTDRAAHSHAKRVLADVDQRREVLDDLTPEMRGRIASDLLADPDTREAVIDEPEGIAAVESMHSAVMARGAAAIHRAAESLPLAPVFAAAFWRAVGAVDAAHAELQRLGAHGIDARPETRFAADRLASNGAEIRDAVVDFVVTNITE